MYSLHHYEVPAERGKGVPLWGRCCYHDLRLFAAMMIGLGDQEVRDAHGDGAIRGVAAACNHQVNEENLIKEAWQLRLHHAIMHSGMIELYHAFTAIIGEMYTYVATLVACLAYSLVRSKLVARKWSRRLSDNVKMATAASKDKDKHPAGVTMGG